MSDQQPEALLLADNADKAGAHAIAAELRRLYAEIERLTAAWHCQHVRKVEERAEAKLWFEHAQKLHAVNAELLEALKLVRDRFFPGDQPVRDRDSMWGPVNAAIAKAEGKS